MLPVLQHQMLALATSNQIKKLTRNQEAPCSFSSAWDSASKMVQKGLVLFSCQACGRHESAFLQNTATTRHVCNLLMPLLQPEAH